VNHGLTAAFFSGEDGDSAIRRHPSAGAITQRPTKTGEATGDEGDERRNRVSPQPISVRRDRQPASADWANEAVMHDRMDRA